MQLYLLSFELILLIKLCTWFHSLSYKLQEEALQRVDATGGVFDLLHGGQSPRSPACSDHDWTALLAVLAHSAPVAPANSTAALLAIVRLLQAGLARLPLLALATPTAGKLHDALWTRDCSKAAPNCDWSRDCYEWLNLRMPQDYSEHSSFLHSSFRLRAQIRIKNRRTKRTTLLLNLYYNLQFLSSR